MILNKDEIKKQLTLEQVFSLLDEWGGEPEYTVFGILSSTICHNPVGVGKRKLYYYAESQLFHCYTDCSSSFDIFDLLIKVFNIQKHLEYSLFEAMKYIGFRFGLIQLESSDHLSETALEDWEIFKRYAEANKITVNDYAVELYEYDENILDRFNYTVTINPWIDERISQNVLEEARIGFYPGGDQITIPHFDKDNRLIGVRGRTLNIEEAFKYGKYRPIKVGNTLYAHPLGMNLYNLNLSIKNIGKIEKAVIFESEKSCLQYRTYFGSNNDISVACCGRNLSFFQVQMLINAGAKELIVAFDRQFQEIGDEEHKKTNAILRQIFNRYKNYINISFIFDKNKITKYKSSPTDEGKDKFLKLFKERAYL